MRSEDGSRSAIVNDLALKIDDYLADCRARGLSLKTVEDNYGFTLRQVFLPWLDRQGIDSLERIDNKTVMRWQGSLLSEPGRRGKPVSRHSADGWVKSVNTFLAWAKEHGEMGHEAKGDGVKKPKVAIDVLTRPEIDKMEQTAQTERDKLIVRVLADTGIRASELLGLRPMDILERDRALNLRVHGKGDKERLVPIPKLGPRLRRFAKGDPSERIFVGLRRRNGQREPLTLSGLQKMIRALAREAGITKRVHPHLMRHSFATSALVDGMNPIQLADILGHVGLTMIQRNYAHLSNRNAYDAMVRFLSKS